MSNNRDIQFMGYAKALVTEIINEVPATIYPLEIDVSDKLEKLLARRAYDLVTSTVWHVFTFSDPDSMSAQEIIDSVPDLPELPREQV